MKFRITIPVLGAVGLSLASPTPPDDQPSPPPPMPAPLPVPAYPTDAIVPTTAPVSLPGVAGVSDGGQPTYQLPLQVPDGAGGMTPSLAITYGGGTANGLLGVGMSLSGGFSSIVPCNHTVATDGSAEGVEWDKGDAYCLDGIRLLWEKVDGLENRFHTEGETFQRIIAKRVKTTDPQPASFEVTGRDGRVSIYLPMMATRVKGVSKDALGVEEGQVAAIYLVDTVTDATGKNQIKYSYEPDPNQQQFEYTYRPSKIEYSKTSSGYQRYIKISYLSRPDPIVLRTAGTQYALRSRVSKIEMFAPNPTAKEAVWSYALTYDTSADTFRSRLASVKQCDKLNVCSWPRVFDWTVGASSHKETVISTQVEFDDESLSRQPGMDLLYQAGRFPPPTDVRIMLLDADADGVDDILYRTKATEFFHVAEPHDVGGTVQYKLVIDHLRGSILFRRGAQLSLREDLSSRFEPDDWIAHLGKTRMVDLDYDGGTDLILARTQLERIGKWQEPTPYSDASDRWTYGFSKVVGYPWTTASLNEHRVPSLTAPAWLMDSMSGSWLWKQFIPTFQRVVADLRGDGKFEFLDAFIDQQLFPYHDEDWFSPFSVHFQRPWYVLDDFDAPAVTSLSVPWTCNNGNAVVSDVDGDGRDDIVTSDMLQTYDGNSFSAQGIAKRSWLVPPGIAQDEDLGNVFLGDCGVLDPDTVVADFNGDGLDDVLYPPGSHGNNVQPKVRWNLGRGYGPLVDMPVTPSQLTANMNQPRPLDIQLTPHSWDRGTRVADINQDGRADIVAMRVNATGCTNSQILYSCATLEEKVFLYLSAGDHFEAKLFNTYSKSGVSSSDGFTTAQLGDVTGDGRLDLVHVVDGRIRVTELAGAGDPVDRILSVRDQGWPAFHEVFGYTDQWWGDGPRPPSTLGTNTYPIRKSRRAFPVVRSLLSFGASRGDGTFAQRTTFHTYDDPASDVRGRGSLGFGVHRIWDRELGRETIREFDHLTRVDLDPDKTGGEFYPFVGLPKRTTVVTPLADRPSAAASDPYMPGLSPGTVPVRVVKTDQSFETRSSIDGHVLLVLPTSGVSEEYESTATLVAGGIPRYTLGSGKTDLRRITTTAQYDEYANPTLQTSQTEGGVYTATVSRYDNRTTNKDWLIGLRTEARTMSFTGTPSAPVPGQPAPPQRVTRAKYDDHGLVWQTTIASWPDDVHDCAGFTEDNPGTCEDWASTAEFGRDTRGNVTSFTIEAADAQTRAGWYVWDAEGVYITQTIDQIGASRTTLRHPAYGLVILDMDALGNQTKLKYDGFGRLRQTSSPGSPTSTRTYTPVVQPGRQLMRVDETGTDLTADYVIFDEVGQLIEKATKDLDNNWVVSSAQYDDLGAEIRTTRPGLGVASAAKVDRTFDRLGRLHVENRDGKLTELTQAMYRTEAKDSEGHRSFVVRDVDDRTVRSGHLVGTVEHGEIANTYGAFGQLATVRDALTNTTRYYYDALGRRTSIEDPDAGVTDYVYDGLGELLEEHSANDDTTTFEYDILGRVIKTIGPDGVTTYTHDIGPNALGRIVKSEGPDPGVKTEMFYDSYGRPIQVDRTIDSIKYTVNRAYDPYGRMKTVSYPMVTSQQPRVVIQYEYANGFLNKVSNATGCATTGCWTALWQGVHYNVDFKVRESKLGTRTVTHDYSGPHGKLKRIEVPWAGFDTSYDYYDDGNLEFRIDNHTGRKETFSYDEMHRLTGWKLDIPDPRTGTIVATNDAIYDYDELGNLRSIKTNDQQTYSAQFGYHGKPNALRWNSVAGDHDYDTIGRQTGNSKRTIDYSQFDLPRLITSPGSSTEFLYDSTGARVRKKTVAGAVTTQVVSVENLYEKRTVGASTSHTFVVQGPEGPVAQIEQTGSTFTTRYLVIDPLGTPVLVMSDTAVLEKSYFDPFGRRVDAEGKDIADPDLPTVMGFTGHNHDDGGLVNMRGRIYDLDQRRFLTPDPIISSPSFGQARNPFSYALNNPLRFNDPSGFQSADSGQPKSEKQPSDAKQPVEVVPITITCTAADPDCSALRRPTPPAAEAPAAKAVATPAPAPAVKSDGDGGGGSSASGASSSGGSEHVPHGIAMAEIAAEAMTRLRGNHMQGVVDEVASKMSYSQMFRKTLAVAEGIDDTGTARYIVAGSGRGLSRAQVALFYEILGDDLLIATSKGLHAERTAIAALEQLGFRARRVATSLGPCDNCAFELGERGVQSITPYRDGRAVREFLPNRKALAESAKTATRVRKVVRALTPALEVVGALLSARSLMDHLASGNYVDSVLGDATGLFGSAVTIVGANPMVGAGLGAFSAGYGITTWGLEWLDSGTKKVDWPE